MMEGRHEYVLRMSADIELDLGGEGLVGAGDPEGWAGEAVAHG